MSEKKCFFQDFLLENMPVDEWDYPDVEVKMCDDYNNTVSSSDMIIYFDRLLRMNKKKEWEALFSKVKDKKIFIIDDVPITNGEVRPIKDFYLGVYYYNLSKHCKVCQVIKDNHK